MSLGTISNIDYVILLCQRMAETREFYLNLMKFSLEMDRPDWVSFRVGSGLLTLRPRGPGLSWKDGPSVAGSASIQLAFRVPPPAVEECHQQLIAMGVEVLSPPKDLDALLPRPGGKHQRNLRGNIEALINIPVETSAISRAAGLSSADYFAPFLSCVRLSIARTRSAAAWRWVRSTSQAGIIPPGSLCSS